MVKSLDKKSVRDATPIIAYDEFGDEIGLGYVTDDVNVNVIVTRFRKNSRVEEIRTGNNLLWKKPRRKK